MSSTVLIVKMNVLFLFLVFNLASASFLVKNSTISPTSLSGVTFNFNLSFRSPVSSNSNRTRRMIDLSTEDELDSPSFNSIDSSLGASVGFSSPARCTTTYDYEPKSHFSVILNGSPSYPYFDSYQNEINKCVFDYFSSVLAGTFYSAPLDRKCNYYNSPNSKCNSPISHRGFFSTMTKPDLMSYCELDFTYRKLPVVDDCFVTLTSGHELILSTSSFTSKVSSFRIDASLFGERFIMLEFPTPVVSDRGLPFNGFLFSPQKFSPFEVLLSSNSSSFSKRKRKDNCVVLCFGHGGSGASTAEVNSAIAHINSALNGFATEVNNRFSDVSKMSKASTEARSLNSQAISSIVSSLRSLHEEVVSISSSSNESFQLINSNFAANQANLDLLFQDINSVSSYLSNSSSELDKLIIEEEVRTFVLSSFSSDKAILSSNFPSVYESLVHSVNSLGFSSWSFLKSNKENDGSVSVSLSLLDRDPFTSTELIGQIPFDFLNGSVKNSCYGDGSIFSKDGLFFYSTCSTCPKHNCSLFAEADGFYLVDCFLTCTPPYPSLRSVYHFSSSGSFVKFVADEGRIYVIDSKDIDYNYTLYNGLPSFDTDAFSLLSSVKVINYSVPVSNFSDIISKVAPIENEVKVLNNYVADLANQITENINVSTIAPLPQNDSEDSSCKESFIGICFDGLEHIVLFLLFMLFLFFLLVVLYHYFAHYRKSRRSQNPKGSVDKLEMDTKSVNIMNGTSSV